MPAAENSVMPSSHRRILRSALLRRAAVIASTGVVLATGAMSAPASAQTVPTGGRGPGSQSFGMFAQPFTSASAEAVTLSPLANLDVADFVHDYQTAWGAVGVNEMPVYRVGPHQARVHVSVAAGCNNFESNLGSVPIPTAASTLGFGDSPLVVEQPSTHSDWEIWQAVHNASGWSACWGGRLDTQHSDGVFPAPWGLSASGISYLATTITEADVRAGSIDHAIAVDLTGCSSHEVAPAVRSDCSSSSGQPGYGTWFRFPASLSMPAGLTPFARMVFRAVQRYGMVFTDQAGAVMIQAESTSDWKATGHRGVDPITASWRGLPEYEVVASLPWSQLQVVSG